MKKHHYGSIIVTDNGRDLVIMKSHTIEEQIRIEWNDRLDLLRCLMDAQGVEDGLMDIVDPRPKDEIPGPLTR
jgi:hypothetical protein